MNGFSFKKPWENGGGDASPSPRGGFSKRGGFRRDRDRDDSFRDGPPRFRGGRKPSFRKPWERDDDRPSFRDRDDSFRDGPPRFREGRKPSFRKPWERSDDRPSFHDRDDRPGPRAERRPFGKPWERGGEADEGRRPFERRPPRAPFAPKKPRVPPIPGEGELVFGRQPVREILRAGRRTVSMLVFADGVKDSPETAEIRALAEERGVEIRLQKREVIEAWTNGANHQGVVATCSDYPYAELDEIADALAKAEGPALVVALDHVQDPQNLGSILRTCECAGVLGVVLPLDRAAAVTAAAVRASAGASEHMLIARVPNLVAALERFKGAGAWITGLEAREGAKPCTEIDFKGKCCIVVGSEAHGLCSPVRSACDFMARLPLRGRVNSLNAGVAAGLAVYEALRQQGAYSDPAAFPAPEEPQSEVPQPASGGETSAEEQ